MGSGYFPFSYNDSESKQLREAVELIKSVRESVWNEIYSGDDGQFDNAASDGGYLRQLSIAISLIQECTRKPKFEVTHCSQCGQEFGPGDYGFSHCDSHKNMVGKE